MMEKQQMIFDVMKRSAAYIRNRIIRHVNKVYGNVLFAAIAGTSAFTLYSYLVSGRRKKNFREPVLLANMLQYNPPGLKRKEAVLSGWAIHYLVGLGFTAFYKLLLQRSSIDANPTTGLFVGAVTAMPAIAGWHITLKAHPHPPGKPDMSFYGNLLVGHIIFGCVCFCFLKKPAA